MNILAVGSGEPLAGTFEPRRSPSLAADAPPFRPEGPLDRALPALDLCTEPSVGTASPEAVAKPLPPSDRMDPAHPPDPKDGEPIGDQ
jgi:hypothetical protein